MSTATSKELQDEQSAGVVANMNAEMDEIKAKAKAAYLLKLRAWQADADARQQEKEEREEAAALSATAAVAHPAQHQPHMSDSDPMSIDGGSPTSLAAEEDDEEEGEVTEEVLSRWQPRKLKSAVPASEGSRSSSMSEASGADVVKQRQSIADTQRVVDRVQAGTTENSRPSPATASKANTEQRPPNNPLAVPKSSSGTSRHEGRVLDETKRSSTSSSRDTIPAKRPSLEDLARIVKKLKQTPQPPPKDSNASAGGLPALKISKKSGTSLKEMSNRVTPEVTTEIAERPPAWYKTLKPMTTRNPDERNAQVLLERLKADVKKAKTSKGDMQQTFENIREELHKLAFEKVSGPLLRTCRALHDVDGLPQLFDASFMGSIKVPWDVQADAEELYNKWCRQIFETDLLRGIIAGKSATKHQEKSVDTIDPAYDGKVSSKFHGNGLLLNGQWWPTQLAAVRDGAHGHTIAGISGTSGEGGYSCIMSGGHDYPDEDHGDWVKYCGTDSTDGSVTEPTHRMLESEKSGKPVRLIRSHNLKSDFAPEIGFRYDGLYKVVGNVNLDGVDSTRQRHQFKLVRLPDQDSIRGKEPGKRPTEQEIKAHKEHKRLRG
ncbi:ubiquitin-like with PHD and RING finger domains 2 [Recurvomyces mirabilis]|uniref:Ubiquitin-like with PHD and RING finger domains 2 n=1 Tax=Recurvomyces mirabilis TaxID=574656 RepID=A0AAE0WM18_9PEZI|nr:ubiquitin-like with PHD and RING finger domains 2 [Recurvomyces mirabilis]KAK5155197.1 hypothetical protein LTS14_006152 [Recurvomyces mirabilis]